VVHCAPDRLGIVWRRVLIALAASVIAVVVTGCRVDVTVDVAMVQNGSGAIDVTVTADEQLVQQAPGLAGDLRLDDLTEAGWTTDGPVGTPQGGLSVQLTHTFDTPEQATALIASLNGTDGPFEAVLFTRQAHSTSIDYGIAGRAKVNGLTGFADPDLLAAVGATPYAADLDAAGLSPDEALGLTFTVTLPGQIETTTATRDEQPLTWSIPFDDTAVVLTTTSSTSLESGRSWTLLATLSFVALGLWVLLSIAFIGFIARRQHQRRTRRRSLSALMDLEVHDDLV
jgi:hypothetical protein